MRWYLLLSCFLLGCPPVEKPVDTGELVYADADGDGYDERVDCDDAAAAVHPGAEERCNGVDDDCDGYVDSDDPDLTDAWIGYADQDSDGWGDDATRISSCEPVSGFVPEPGDCDDGDAAVNPGAEELCNGADDDCDGEIDEDLADLSSWYPDADGDGYGDEDAVVEACEAPDDHIELGGDCDDGDPAVNPDAGEVCNGIDDDCDGAVDDDAEDAERWYEDLDGDGFGNRATLVWACEQPSGHSATGGDCDDGDPAVSPDAGEVCNGIDDDCDGITDNDAEDAPSWYQDLDSDGYGDPSSEIVDCTAPSGAVGTGGDCDDRDAAVNPGATEICNGVDDDCDGAVDVGVLGAPTWYPDADGDGYGGTGFTACTQPSGTVTVGGDCDDSSAAIHPGADEYCNGVDDDCDGSVDVGAVDEISWYQDSDGDAYGDVGVSTTACSGPSGTVADATDCDDSDATVHPGADEHCDGVDEDCDGSIDEDAVDMGSWYVDSDGDGYGDSGSATLACTTPSGSVATGGDCDDSDPAVNPAASEICNGADDDCDGTVDIGAVDAPSWYADADGDGYGDGGGGTTLACTAPSGTVADDSDCDDSDAGIHPGADEHCDSVDEDCDGSIDEDAVDMGSWYVDSDGDGYGDDGASTLDCGAPTGMVASGGDCDDSDAGIHPGADEHCDGVDEDCDGSVDEDAVDGSAWYADADGDGYGDPTSSVTECSAPSGTVADDDDCDDTDPAINPGATEYCDGVDTDCDGVDDPSDTVTFIATGGGKTDATGYFSTTTPGPAGRFSLSSDGQLNFCAGSYEGFIDVSASAASIVGLEGSAYTVLSGGYTGTMITALSGAAVLDVTGLSLTEGVAVNGGAISSDIAGLVFVGEDLVIDWSAATNHGGGIYMKDAASVTLTEVAISECGAVRGGALYIEEGGYLIEDLILELSLATERGGGSFIKNATGTATGLMVAENLCSDDGGGLYLEGTEMTLSDSLVIDNSCTDKGGGIYLKNNRTELVMSSSSIETNLADRGGGLFVDDSSATCTGTATSTVAEGVLGNLATRGGGLYLKGGNGYFQAVSCDFGSGSTDNDLYDTYVEKGARSYSSYVDDADFECDEDRCW